MPSVAAGATRIRGTTSVVAMPTVIPALFTGLIDDAAVFPPGNATVPAAIARHREHRSEWYGEAIGPLLVPAQAVGEVIEVLSNGSDAASHDAAGSPVVAGRVTADGLGAPTGPGALDLGLIVRPGADTGVIASARALAAADPRVRVVTLEFGWSPDWRDATDASLPIALEVPRGGDQTVALTDIRDARGEGRQVVAKFRTGPTPSWAWPDEAELAAFITAAREAAVPFKLTGGLHHVLRGEYVPTGGGPAEDNHGLLNILAATELALTGATAATVADLLGRRDVEALGTLARSWSDETVHAIRTAFTAYGCCTVTDPVGELHDLTLLRKD